MDLIGGQNIRLITASVARLRVKRKAAFILPPCCKRICCREELRELELEDAGSASSVKPELEKTGGATSVNQELKDAGGATSAKQWLEDGGGATLVKPKLEDTGGATSVDPELKYTGGATSVDPELKFTGGATSVDQELKESDAGGATSVERKLEKVELQGSGKLEGAGGKTPGEPQVSVGQESWEVYDTRWDFSPGKKKCHGCWFLAAREPLFEGYCCGKCWFYCVHPDAGNKKKHCQRCKKEPFEGIVDSDAGP